MAVTFTDDAGNNRDADQRSDGCGGGSGHSQQPGHRRAHHQRNRLRWVRCWTVDTSAIADADGLNERLSSTYQWMADDADISGATSFTYTLADTDEGKAIKVRGELH